MSAWINNYDPQSYKGGPYIWEYGGRNGYRGFSGQPGFKRDLGYTNMYQGIGNYYTGPKCPKCNLYYDDSYRCACYDYPDGDPYNPFDDNYKSGLAWNLR